MSPEVCPNCGGDVPRNAKACPECGSSEDNGWSEAAAADNLGIPSEEFDYKEFVEREFAPKTPKPRGISWFWWIVAIIVLIVLLALFTHRL